MVRRLLAGIALAAPLAAQDVRQQGSALTWPAYTEQQRWNRSGFLMVSWATGSAAYAKAQGKSLDEFATWFADLYAPGWGAANAGSAVRMARGILFNAASIPNSEASLVSASDTSATLRFRRSHVTYFGESGRLSGITVAEYEHVLDVFHKHVATYLGLRYASRVADDWIVITISGRGANAITAIPQGVFTATITAEQAGSPAGAGDYEVTMTNGRYESRRNGQLAARGTYTTWLDQVTFVQDTGAVPCATSGVYRFSPQANGDVVVGRLADQCESRGRIAARRWTKKQ